MTRIRQASSILRASSKPLVTASQALALTAAVTCLLKLLLLIPGFLNGSTESAETEHRVTMGTSRGAGLVVGLFVVAMVVMSNIGSTEATLTTDYYDECCPQIYSIVKEIVHKAVEKEARMAASLVRLHFHDCFVNGCDGSILLDNTTDFVSEKEVPANKNSARGFEVVDAVKAALEDACPQTVSCADILTIVSRDSAVEAGFVPEYPVSFGRLDSFTGSFFQANLSLPSPNFNYTELKNNFAAVGLNELDLVTLSGAHTIGRVKCGIVRNVSLKNAEYLNNTNSGFRDFLNKTVCPPGTEIPTGPENNLTFVFTDLDLHTPDTFDTNYYKNLRKNQGMIPSDQTLQDTPGVNQAFVTDFAYNKRNFFRQFALSTIKMGNISPKQGDEGEIRLNCRKRNPFIRTTVPLIASQ